MQRHLRLLKRTSQRRVNFRREARDDGSGFAEKYRGGEKLETSETLLCQGALKSVWKKKIDHGYGEKYEKFTEAYILIFIDP